MNWMMEGREVPVVPSSASKEENSDLCFQIPPPEPKGKKNKVKNTKRFSEEQIKFLETIFKSETRLEPRKKLQLAREIGLQPRQIAIWFQNKRARWKVKQIEHEYQTLKANYDSLASRFEYLKIEKQTLLIQLQKLNENLGNSEDSDSHTKNLEVTKTDNGSENVDNNNGEPEAKLSFLQGLNQEKLVASCQDHTSNPGMYWEEGDGNLNIGEQTNVSLAASGKWESFTSANLYDHQSGSNLHWLDFWT